MGTSSSRPITASSYRSGPPAQTTGGGGFSRIADNFSSLQDVQNALRREGLESSNLLVAVDFTKSNEWTGKYSYGGKSLHHIAPDEVNPYQRVIGIVARTLGAFDDDNLIPCYGFGDATTGDRRVFSFKEHDQPCVGLEEVEAVYRALTPQVKLAGPTSFAPAIYQAMKIVADSGNQYHILLLVADGQVTRSSDAAPGQFSPQEAATIDAIVKASAYPLSIVMIGVGDGPWDMMREFDDQLPERKFDNFQFVNATQIMQRFTANDWQRMEATFARDALMEIPEQYKAIQRMGLVGRSTPLNCHVPAPAPPPVRMMPAAPPPQPYGYTYPPAHPHAPAPGQPPYTGAPPGPYSQGATYPPQGKAGYEPMVASMTAPQPQRDSVSGNSSAYASAIGSERSSAASVQISQSFGAGGHSVDAGPQALFVCPITQELMSDPVLAADGYTYDRGAIERWLQTHNTSPMTNAPLPHKSLTPNHALRSSILEYRQNTGQ